jgi:hypothetical protein
MYLSRKYLLLNWELIASGTQAPLPVGAIASGSKAPIEQAVYMKLTKKQLSASYVMQATAATVGIHTGDVANHRGSRLYGCSVASPEGKVEFIPYVSFCKTSGEKAMESMAGLENQPGVEITPLQLYVEEGPQSVKFRDTCYGNGKAGWQWQRSDGGYLR